MATFGATRTLLGVVDAANLPVIWHPTSTGTYLFFAGFFAVFFTVVAFFFDAALTRLVFALAEP
jgi:hypothetical protein